MINALTIDVEDYFQVPTIFNNIKNEGEKYLSRVERNTYHILELLNGECRTPNFSSSTPNVAHGTPIKATFFCLGWIAKKVPRLIKEINAQGHEIACHGFTHHIVYLLSKEEFKRDIQKGKAVLEDLTGSEVVGYRAPCYSITQSSLWALKVLAKEGFKYDSSVYPVRHKFYGIPDSPRSPFWVSMNGDSSFKFSLLNVESKNVLASKTPILNSKQSILQSIIEFPLSTIQLAKFNLPIGNYFLRLPFFIFKKGLKRINEIDNQPFVFCLHPWELEFSQPRTKGTGLNSKKDQSRNLEKKEDRLKVLFKEFKFSSIKDILGEISPPL